MTKMATKSYSELIKMDSFIDRYRYLRIGGKIGEDTFGFNRYLNQVLYRSKEWKEFRRRVIIRDESCDLGVFGFDIVNPREILVHHINPITLEDIYKRNPAIFDFENVITTRLLTHNAIHFGDESIINSMTLVERKPNDTCPWK